MAHGTSIPIGQRCCSRCRLIKPQVEFPPSTQKRTTRVGGYCSACESARHRERYGPVRTHEELACGGCGEKFRPRGHAANGAIVRFCSKKCQVRHRAESGRARDYHLRRVHGITHADYERLLAEQGGGCALCGVKPEGLTAGRYRKHLHVDHDHTTNAVRGLLCPDHNLLLGRFGDSVEMFRKVIEYLEARAS